MRIRNYSTRSFYILHLRNNSLGTPIEKIHSYLSDDLSFVLFPINFRSLVEKTDDAYCNPEMLTLVVDKKRNRPLCRIHRELTDRNL